MHQVKKFIYVFTPIAALVLVVSQIIISNELAGARSVIRSLDSEIVTLSEEHDILTQQVASASALTTLSIKAALSGFIAPTETNVMALDDSYTVAQAPGSTSVQ